MENNLIAEIKDYEGATISLYTDKLVVDRSKAWSVSFGRGLEVNQHGKGIRTIPLHSIQAVEYKEAYKKRISVIMGVLELIMPGGDNGIAMNAAQARMSNNNRFMFLVEYNAAARKMKEYIEDYILNARTNSATVVQQTSAADELKKFKELLDMGIITQEEFNAKKKQLLGL